MFFEKKTVVPLQAVPPVSHVTLFAGLLFSSIGLTPHVRVDLHFAALSYNAGEGLPPISLKAEGS